jgi:type I restriction enzyme R subunit
MSMIDQREKTLVFCASQPHAALVRDLINQVKSNPDPMYCVRVTANDGERGEQNLRQFQDNEKTIPTILTTSQKLSTGVDARNVRNIVLMRPIRQMVEFKQIIGRGTRLYEGKAYFTIYDFVKAYEHFNDPEWDGPPEVIDGPEPGPRVCPRCGEEPCVCEITPPPPPGPCEVCGQEPCVCVRVACPVCGSLPCRCNKRKTIKVKLADGKERQIQNMVATSFWSPDGRPMSAAEFIERLFGEIPALFKDEDELRRLWGNPDTRKALLDGLAEKGFGDDQLTEMAKIINAEKSDLYDVLAYVAYASAPITREERVATRRNLIFGAYDANRQAFLEFVLDHYVAQGVGELASAKLPRLLQLKYHDVNDAIAQLGDVDAIRSLFVGFQPRLYDARIAS